MNEIIIGIDPGMNGAIVFLGKILKEPWILKFNDQSETDVADWLRIDNEGASDCFAYLERSSPMPKQGVSSTFKFGQGYGFLRGLLVAFKIPFETVTPGKWQRALGCLSHGDKNVTKARAQELFPSIKITHAIADALLIAEYGRRQRLGRSATGASDGNKSTRS